MPRRVATATSIPALAALLTGLVGCGADNKAAAPPASKTTPEATAPTKAGEQPAAQAAPAPGEKVKVVEGAAPEGDDRYAVQIKPPEAKVGEESTVIVRVVPKAPWHINLDFPTSLRLDPPPSVTLAKAELKKADAAALDDDKAQFDVKITPTAAGDQRFTGTFKFAVCQDDACSPVTEDVEFQVAVR